MATDSNRLDRLEALAERLLEIAQQQQMQGIRHEGEIGDLKQSTADLRASTADLRASTADLVSMISTLADQQSEISADVRKNSADVRKNSADVRGLQLESRRILDYLFRQQGGEPPEV
jgi:phage shock protein A